MTKSLTDFKMVPMYVGKCPRCSKAQENLYEKQVNIICSECHYAEMQIDKQVFIDTIHKLNDIVTNLSTHSIDFAYNDKHVQFTDDIYNITIIGKSGTKYDIHISSYQLEMKVLE